MRISLTHWFGMVGLLTLISCSSEQTLDKPEPEYTGTQVPQLETVLMLPSKAEPEYKDIKTLPATSVSKTELTPGIMVWSSEQLLNKAESKYPFPKKPALCTAVPTEYKVVQVFFATDRNLTENGTDHQSFGDKRATMSYGTCEVSIPHDHRMGELEAPSIWKLEFQENPSEHVVIQSTVVKQKKQFFTDVADCIRKSGGKKAFIFIHGYNVTFEDATRRTAQMAYDLKFDGAPVFYSWPSKGKFTAYFVDEENIDWAQTDLKNFLNDFFEQSDAQNIYLIAHSMGNRALTRAIASLLSEKPSIKSRLKEIILTAPDIDADVFRRDIAPALSAPGNPITTLYVSSNDLAFGALEQFYEYPRAGDPRQGLIVVPGIETIDATNVNTSFIGHSYFAENRSVISDIYYMLQGLNTDQRHLLSKVETQNGCYWEFKK